MEMHGIVLTKPMATCTIQNNQPPCRQYCCPSPAWAEDGGIMNSTQRTELQEIILAKIAAILDDEYHEPVSSITIEPPW